MTEPIDDPRTGVFVPGVTGRMGRLLADVALADPACELLGVTARPGAAAVGKPLSSWWRELDAALVVHPDLDAAHRGMPPDGCASAVLVDFTTPALCAPHAAFVRQHGIPWVVGTTGLNADAQRAVDEAACHVAVLQAANTSLGANLLMTLTEQAAAALPRADVEVVELHHRGKKDAPSGTALSLAAHAASARGRALGDVQCTAREGIAPRQPDEIGLFGVRGGDVPGEHTVYFFLDGERIELVHRVQDRRIFAVGAITAAHFLRGKPPGKYTMVDVLHAGREP